MSSDKSPSFSLLGSGGALADRQKALFASLDEADKSRNDGLQQRSASKHRSEVEEKEKPYFPSRHRRSNMKKFQGQESIFKKPDIPVRLIRRPGRPNPVPDFKRNPHKWTKYSLEDVEEMSDRSNSAAAFAFLQEIQKRREAQSLPMDDDVDANSPIKFKRKSKANTVQDSAGKEMTVTLSKSSEEGEKPSYQNSKLVMPEYVFGKKKSVKKSKNSTPAESASSSRIKLDHLIDEESSD